MRLCLSGVALFPLKDLPANLLAIIIYYGYKVGNKARVQKKWEKLPEGERVLAMASIARYRRFAEGKKIEMVYPETYIDQRRWENEFTN